MQSVVPLEFYLSVSFAWNPSFGNRTVGKPSKMSITFENRQWWNIRGYHWLGNGAEIGIEIETKLNNEDPSFGHSIYRNEKSIWWLSLKNDWHSENRWNIFCIFSRLDGTLFDFPLIWVVLGKWLYGLLSFIMQKTFNANRPQRAFFVSF